MTQNKHSKPTGLHRAPDYDAKTYLTMSGRSTTELRLTPICRTNASVMKMFTNCQWKCSIDIFFSTITHIFRITVNFFSKQTRLKIKMYRKKQG